MLDTTNIEQTTKTYFHRMAETRKALATLDELQQKRVVVESRGDPDEYDALAREFSAAGFTANADTLTRKAAGMRKARMA